MEMASYTQSYLCVWCSNRDLLFLRGRGPAGQLKVTSGRTEINAALQRIATHRKGSIGFKVPIDCPMVILG